MDKWQYRAYKAEPGGKRISEIVEGEMAASSFTHLALLLRQRGLQVIEAVRPDPNKTLAAKRLAKMKARVSLPEEPVPEELHVPATSAIRRWFSWLISPFVKR